MNKLQPRKKPTKGQIAPKEVWERQPGETALKHRLFTMYLTMGPLERTLQAVADQSKKTLNTLKQYSVQHSWVSRAAAYDEYLDRRTRDELEQARIQMAMLQYQAGADFIRKGLEKIKVTNLENIEQAKGLVTTGADLQRKALGEPTEIIRQETQSEQTVRYAGDVDFRKLSVEELRIREQQDAKLLKSDTENA